jgi:hypothetical protein
LLALANVRFGFVAGEALSCPADGEPVVVKKAANLPNDQHVLPLIIAAIASPLDRFQLWKFLFPVAKHVRLDSAQVADFPYREISLPRNWR